MWLLCTAQLGTVWGVMDIYTAAAKRAGSVQDCCTFKITLQLSAQLFNISSSEHSLIMRCWCCVHQ